MKFKNAVLRTPALAQAFQPGLRALKASDAARIACENPRLLAGSVDVDAALSRALPNEPRWDYAVGVKQDHDADFVIWIELHPASSTGEVNVVLTRLSWLKRWTNDAAPSLWHLPGKYVWIATSKVAFSHYSPQRKRLAMAGLEFSGGRYHIKTG